MLKDNEMSEEELKKMAKMRDFLLDEFGIYSNEELAAALRGMKKANLAIMLSPIGKEAGVGGTVRIGTVKGVLTV